MEHLVQKIYEFFYDNPSLEKHKTLSDFLDTLPRRTKRTQARAERDCLDFNVICCRTYFPVYLQLFSASFSSRFLQIDHYSLRPERINLLKKTLN
jgi:hypothetical protein